jgi:hypothetical protein
MSNNILCFSWNTDNIPICENYLNNNTKDIISKPGGVFSKPSKCLNPLFFTTIEDYISKYNPFIVVINTENEAINGSLFHDKFLPENMNRLNYRLLVTDHYESPNDKNQLMVSIYVKKDDPKFAVLQLNKGLIFDDNKILCGNIAEQSKAMCLYVNTSYGVFAFVGVQMQHNYSERRDCIKNIEEKFLIGKPLSYSFIMGDFANTYLATKKDLSNYEVVDGLRQTDWEVFGTTREKGNYIEGIEDYPTDVPRQAIGMNLTYPPKVNGNKKFVVPNYSPSYNNDFVNSDLNNDYKSIATYEKLINSKYGNKANFTIGYHDKIFYNDFRAHSQGKKLKCLDYSSITGSPMLMKGEYNSEHLGTIGIYEIITAQ